MKFNNDASIIVTGKSADTAVAAHVAVALTVLVLH